MTAQDALVGFALIVVGIITIHIGVFVVLKYTKALTAEQKSKDDKEE